MPSRGLLLILIAGLILAIGAVGAARRDARQRTDQTTVQTQPQTLTPADTGGEGPAGTGGVEANVVSATLPSDRVVHAKLGDEIELHVTSQAPDIVTILQLAVKAPVGPGISGPVRFSALQAGTFDVRLELAQSVIGRVSVAGPSGR